MLTRHGERPTRLMPPTLFRILKLLDREGLQFLHVKVAVFRKRQHHRGDAFAAHFV